MKGKSLTRKTEKGETIPFTDPFFDYSVRVKHMKLDGSIVIRAETDAVTSVLTYRRLINVRETEGRVEAQLLRQFSRVESMSHVLVWTAPFETSEVAFGATGARAVPALVDLPRLRIRFEVSICEDGSPRLSVSDRGDIFVLSQQDEAKLSDNTLLNGLSRCLMLSDATGNLELFVPNYPLKRPKVSICPFTTSCVAVGSDPKWLRRCDARYYSYPIHPGNSFVAFPSVGAALYWGYRKLMSRDYHQAFKVILVLVTEI